MVRQHRVILCGMLSLVSAQIKILNPPNLMQQFKDGVIIGSTATFGAPTYGEAVVGKVIYRKPIPEVKGGLHCTKESYSNYENLLKEETIDEKTVENQEASAKARKEKKIFLVERGQCSFVTKVRVAEELGADAVIVVDKQYTGLTADTIHTVIMADDGWGSKIKIPSILVSNEDGQKLIQTATATAEGGEMVSLNWDIPVNDVAIVDLWMTSSSKPAYDFLKNMKEFSELLSYKLAFVPHYHIYDSKTDYNNFCLKDNTFCADDPDNGGKVTGKEVVEESLRQLCLWHSTQENDPESSLVKIPATVEKPSNTQVKRSWKYWEYMTSIFDRCQMSTDNNTSDDMRFGHESCSYKLMIEKGINVDKVKECIRDQGTKLLEHERDNSAWSAFALRINGWRYAGHIEADLVKKAICTAYVKQPDVCKYIFSGTPYPVSTS